ncbi:Dinitrogenase iron-molybdenum cofactor biosynthesis protein [Methanococcus vannielii SB]|uniref:Dinitrogenase iron-molybdenum cofactor biosynthesis protein n=1 Tax=Methanococcus vannielii (strain ATCC 35089 / DSM 1224 / JCM 13029 / OCM 148 / SB) TaxID=406327 RepID=A6US54_METVS|nr:NifB/NifX family molybdenum-iron cluster-binding protein [Methanococcus vannielii]ABR55326.1 Dinitrogenase iron-molybdenum cofactor biosynthesis protein [Methanococcus vannielii SB]
MKIAIPTIENKICSHFGKTPFFTIFEINENKEVINAKKIENSPCEGHDGGQKHTAGNGSTIETLLSENVDAVIFINMGQKSINALSNRIKLHHTDLKDVESALKQFLENRY